MNGYISLGAMYVRMSEMKLAQENQFKALRIAEELDHIYSIATCLGNLGSLYDMMEDYEKALYYYEKGKEIAMRDTSEYGSLAYAYYNLARIYQEQKKYTESLENAHKSIYYCKKCNDKIRECLTYQHMAYSYQYQETKDNKNAIYAAQQMQQIAEELNLPALKQAAWSTLGCLYHAEGMYKESVEAALKSIEADSLDWNMVAQNLVVIVYSSLGNKDYEKVEEYFDRYREMQSKFLDKSLHDALAGQEVKYETEKKELRIAALLKEKALYYWIIGLAVVVAVTMLLFYLSHRRNAKRRIRHLEQEKQLVAAEAVIDGESTERARLARDLHDGLGGMLSAVKINLNDIDKLQNARDMLDNSIEELRRVAHHLMPASLLRFGMKASLEDYCNSFPNVHFHYFGEDRRIPEKLEILVYRCVYELVNNAVKHSQAANINVQLIL
ncbi:MAG: tetratricopeptide repeat protein, partial [Tannerella sp.]|nr:tetratricopeptide repeat protein [Tannerella sp.]